jgi:hypothetical protein
MVIRDLFGLVDPVHVPAPRYPTTLTNWPIYKNIFTNTAITGILTLVHLNFLLLETQL